VAQGMLRVARAEKRCDTAVPRRHGLKLEGHSCALQYGVVVPKFWKIFGF